MEMFQIDRLYIRSRIRARRAARRKVLEQKVGLIATLRDDQNDNQNPKIIGTLLLAVYSKNDPPIKVRNYEVNHREYIRFRLNAKNWHTFFTRNE